MRFRHLELATRRIHGRWWAACGAAVAIAGAVFARSSISTPGAISAFAAAVLVILSAIDIDRRRVPNVVVLPATAVVLVARSAVSPDSGWIWVSAAVGAAAVFFVLAVAKPGGLGMGDVKLVLLIGAALGTAVIEGLLIGTLSAAAASLVIIGRHGAAARNRALPYAPFLSFGAICMLLIRP